MLFMGHKFIVINQRKAIKDMMDGIYCSPIVLLMDYKIKYEPEHYHENRPLVLPTEHPLK